MSLIGSLIVGLLAGWLAGFFVSKSKDGCLWNCLIGLVGGFIGGNVLSWFGIDTRVRDKKIFRKVPIALISLRVPAVLPAYCQRNNRL